MAETIVIKPHDFELTYDVQKLQDVSSRQHLEEFIDFKKRDSNLSDRDAKNLRESTCDILSFCNPHNATNNIETTHLVVGYVQSGKTMSFTSLIELALDYQYRIIVIFAGGTNNLLDQTYGRLRKDLKCGDASNRHFKVHKNPDISDIQNITRDLRQSDTTIVITVLKHYERINKLTELFNHDLFKEKFVNETVLIIDDEADQASLNNFGRENSKEGSEEYKMSTTYESIVKLRNSLPGNSYVQYTATPQANILINAIDILSPKTHTLLYPGEGYCGGKQFFGKGENGEFFNGKLIIEIPQDQVFNKSERVLSKMPDSLEEAIMMHIWAVTLVIRYFKISGINQLSMMIHMDETIDWNNVFYNWVNEKLNEWADILDSKDEEKYNLLMARFNSIYSEATRFYDDNIIPSFDSVKGLLAETINDTQIYLINSVSDDMDNLEWDDYSSNILIGAQMLNRGFTVENLATTYLSRYTVSITNADTIEQRCRFFGYKKKYIRSCRVYLPSISKINYLNYIESEEELRFAMSQTKSLDELGHRILIGGTRLSPTRKQVLPIETVNSKFKKTHDFHSYESESVMKYNFELTKQFINKHLNDWQPLICQNYNATEFKGMRSHKSIRIPVDEAISFLKEYQFTNSVEKRYCADTLRYLFYLSNKKENPIKDILVIYMGNGLFKDRPLDVTTYKLSTNLFEGGSSTTDPFPHYPGDRYIFDPNTITIQLHNVKLRNLGSETTTIAINYPPALAVTYCNSDSSY